MSFDRTMRTKYLSEFTGTFLLVFGVKMIVGSGTALAAIGVGILLMILVYEFGHTSGAHLNPAVTIAIFIRNPSSMPRTQIIPYIMYLVVQFIGGILGGLFACAAGGDNACGIYTYVNTDKYTVAQAFFSELIFTFMLCSMVLNVATDARSQGNAFFGVGIGLTLTVAAMSIGPITGCAINPAVWAGTALSATVSVDELANVGASYIYFLAHAIAAIGAGFWFLLFYGGEEANGKCYETMTEEETEMVDDIQIQET